MDVCTAHPIGGSGAVATAAVPRVRTPTSHLFCALVAHSGVAPQQPQQRAAVAARGDNVTVAPRYALLSGELTPAPGAGTAGGAWAVLSEYEVVGSLPLAEPAVVTGLVYRWPFPPDQAGTVWAGCRSGWGWVRATLDGSDGGPWAWVLVANPPLDDPAAGAVAPQHVFFVRAVRRASDPLGAHADGVVLVDGDRVLELGAEDGAPRRTLLWRAADGLLQVDVADLAPAAAEGLLVVALAGGTSYGHHGFWHPPAPAGSGIWHHYTVAIDKPHPRTGPQAAVRLTTAAATPTDHAFALLTRSPELLYAAPYAAVASNLPVVVGLPPAPGAAPAFRPAGLTDGLLGPRFSPAHPDRAAVRLVAHAGDVSTDPDYVRINIDMGQPVVVEAFAWLFV